MNVKDCDVIHQVELYYAVCLTLKDGGQSTDLASFTPSFMVNQLHQRLCS